jgi:outer membrane protein OmpA-like peptidoglycan-associated protein
MNTKLFLSTACGIAAGAFACASPPNPNVQRAEAAYDAAANDPEVTTYAPLELREAETALDRAQRAERRDEDDEIVDHLAYLAQRRIEIAEVAGDRKHDAADARNVDVDVHVHPTPSVSAPPPARVVVRTPILTDLDAALIELRPEQTDRGVVIVMDDVWFDRERSAIRPDALPDLSRLADYLRAHDDLDVIVEGHADRNEVDRGTVDLSYERAEAIEDYFEDQGVDDDRITTRALGASEPLTAGATPLGRQANRRVEIVVVE